ncbi:MAG: hypothetical protein ABIO81_12925 [Ginsengibacter sp.]
MTKQLIKLIVLLIFINCNSNSSEEKENPDVEIQDTVFESATTTTGDSSLVIKNSPSIWSADFEESTNTYKIHKPVNSRLDTLSVEKIVSLINISWDSIHLNFLKISHDTMYVSIPDSRYLAQNIGSTGAENYMATSTFSLTEMKGIKYVNFKFTEGDHAYPGTYSRNDFKNFK